MDRKTTPSNTSKGTLKKRILMLAENSARLQYFMTPIMSEAEAEAIASSITSKSDIAYWEKVKQMDSKVMGAIQNIQGLSFELMMHKSNLRGYILLWNAIETSELLANSILQEIPNKDERKEISKRALNQAFRPTEILLSKTSVDEEGYIELSIDFEKEIYSKEVDDYIPSRRQSLQFAMDRVREDVIDRATTLKSWIAALRDYMKRNSFNLKVYKEKIDSIEDLALSDVVNWSKYLESQKNFNYIYDNSTLIDSIKQDYSIVPDLHELKHSKDQYEWFTVQFLSDKKWQEGRKK